MVLILLLLVRYRAAGRVCHSHWPLDPVLPRPANDVQACVYGGGDPAGGQIVREQVGCFASAGHEDAAAANAESSRAELELTAGELLPTVQRL